jgi:hypothetical protein
VRALLVVLCWVLFDRSVSATSIPNYAAVVESVACEALGSDVFHPLRDAERTEFFLGHPLTAPEKGLRVSCGNSAVWRLYSEANDAGALAVGVCDGRTELTGKHIETAKRFHEDVASLGRDGAESTDQRDRQAYSPPQHRLLRAGKETTSSTFLP